MPVDVCVSIQVDRIYSAVAGDERLSVPRLSLQLSSSSSSLLSRSHLLRLTAQRRPGRPVRHFAAGSPSNSFVKLPARGYADVSRSGARSLDNLRSHGTD